MTAPLLAFAWSWDLDGWIVLAGILAAVAAALPGTFLVLRRMSLMGDAISHAVLPGLAVAFLVSGSRDSLPMFAGALVVGVLTAYLTEWIRDAGRVDESASLGVTFTALFALGLVLIVKAADRVDLDPGCVLYGAIELTPLDRVEVLGAEIPRAVVVLGSVALANAALLCCFWKEMRLAAFDPAFARGQGVSPRLMHLLLMTMTAVTTVAAFESVGNILVVALLVVPPAAAQLASRRLAVVVVLAALFGAASAVLGHLGAITLPALAGFESTSTSGMMAVAAGAILAVVVAMTLAGRLRRVTPRP
ncbi:MAG: metal ABC transporter permease [Phycisphaerales bacterium]